MNWENYAENARRNTGPARDLERMICSRNKVETEILLPQIEIPVLERRQF